MHLAMCAYEMHIKDVTVRIASDYVSVRTACEWKECKTNDMSVRNSSKDVSATNASKNMCATVEAAKKGMQLKTCLKRNVCIGNATTVVLERNST
jgi:hypothetical protein